MGATDTTTYTLDQFLDGYAKLLRLVRTRMLGQSANAASASASVL